MDDEIKRDATNGEMWTSSQRDEIAPPRQYISSSVTSYTQIRTGESKP